MPKTAVKATKEPKFHILIFVILILAIIGISTIYLANFTSLNDRISTLFYSAPAEVTALEDKIDFTEPATYTFRATRPSLESREQFNESCRSHNADISVLGCYTGGRMYIYDIKTPELSGIIESTAAHEFLHAAWDRLPESEKNTVSTYLNQVYAEHKDALSEDLSNYDAADQLDELHSRIGTQIADLPDYLEKYYANYFKDQDKVVGYYNSYIKPFNEIKSQMDSLKEELDTLKAQIDADTENYYSRAQALSTAIDEFNSCANQAGCFGSSAEFNNRRAELVSEQDEVSELYSKINAAVETYNQKVEAYNNNILRTEELQNAVNSNAKVNNQIDS
ncbi:hypothetical protein IKG54_02250 [Candidatus Saccharibacteria bacterium]|nr:hypothetical protein [Candidatus Saccharibacteria bacterium]